MARRGDGTSNRRRKRRRDLPAPEHIAGRDELDAWLAVHQDPRRRDGAGRRTPAANNGPRAVAARGARADWSDRLGR
jgi:hypothetical protein